MVGRSKLLDNRSLSKGHIVLVCRDNLATMCLSGVLDQLEEARLHLLAVDNEGTTKYLVATMLGVDLCETKHLRVGQWTATVFLNLFEVVHLVFRECQTFTLVVGLQIVDMYDRLWLTVGSEHLLVKALVHTLQHRVMIGILVSHREIFLNAGDAR